MSFVLCYKQFNLIHHFRIIYRDLKPENIGFDVRGDLKIFDFGLSKEVRNPDADGNYALTGYAGSPIYMAPEGKIYQYVLTSFLIFCMDDTHNIFFTSNSNELPAI